ncbi:hypothetical protein K438DRAFT_1748002 [Mycena galopus ATCC 62051]|nr:hypothetical protein K438DRAFT_1748002 [Mycena galopus ATCC 62051]
MFAACGEIPRQTSVISDQILTSTFNHRLLEKDMHVMVNEYVRRCLEQNQWGTIQTTISVSQQSKVGGLYDEIVRLELGAVGRAGCMVPQRRTRREVEGPFRWVGDAVEDRRNYDGVVKLTTARLAADTVCLDARGFDEGRHVESDFERMYCSRAPPARIDAAG